ncbi:hypothetical protein [Frankia sp. ArI3]|uniref:hypothetical protein n=1 Tax=Frankia sp. ArI3 TaxID=1858 RepID=UPI002102DCC6|nr:hypothetical protein [Frankia sp. ArI3]
MGLARPAQPGDSDARRGRAGVERGQLGVRTHERGEQRGRDGVGTVGPLRAPRGGQDAVELEAVEHGRRA